MGRERKNNRGFTLVELIVVVAVIAVALTLVLSSFGSVYSAQVRQCSQEIDDLLAKCKVGAMSRAEDVYLQLYVTGDGIYGACYEGDLATDDDKLGKATVFLSYTTDLNSSPVKLAEGDSLYLGFDRATGALETLGTDAPNDSSAHCTSLLVSNGSNAKTIVLVPQTGKHYIE